MLKYLVLLYFLTTTVSGQLQNQLHRGQSLSSVDQPQTLQAVSAGLTNSANSKPCGRRNNVENSDALSPDANLVQKLQSQSVHPLNQKLLDEADERFAKGTPPPSNTYEVSVQQDHNILVQRDIYRDSEEEEVLRKSNVDNLLDNQDDLCQKLGENRKDVKSDDERNNLNTNNKHGSNKVHKQALELLSKCVQKDKDENDEESEGNTRRSNNELNKNKPEENSYAYEPSKSNEEKRRRKFRNRELISNEVPVQPKHPAQGEGISSLAESRVLLLHNSRVCFACTTTNDPSCWNPDQTTTVKYCKKEDDACITKTFKANNDLITIRDCGNSCTDNEFLGVPQRYKSCRICHSDQCNGADAITSLNLLLVGFFISAIKFTF